MPASRKAVEAGLAKKYPVITEELRQRVEHELAIISQTRQFGYIFQVQKILGWAHANGIPVGPGRGAAPGSVVLYALGITGIDPLQHGLYFERFLNPERASLPDIDPDVCFDRRGELMEYIRTTWGAEQVTRLTSYGTWRPQFLQHEKVDPEIIERLRGVKRRRSSHAAAADNRCAAWSRHTRPPAPRSVSHSGRKRRGYCVSGTDYADNCSLCRLQSC